MEARLSTPSSSSITDIPNRAISGEMLLLQYPSEYQSLFVTCVLFPIYSLSGLT